MTRERTIDATAAGATPAPSMKKRKREDDGPSPVSVGRRELPGGPSMDSVEVALGLTDWKFRTNLLSRTREVKLSVDWQELNDDMLSSVRYELNKRFYWSRPPKKKDEGWVDVPYQLTNERTFLWPVAMTLCDRNPVNPLTSWLEECKAKAAGTDPSLLEEWLGKMFDFPETYPDAVRRWASRRLVCAIVARIVHPGTPWPRMLILFGEQGIGKSCLARNLLPPGPEWDPYYTNEFHFGMRPASLVHAVRGKVVVECDEMSGSKKEVEDMRSFVTRNIDGSGERLVYRRNPEPTPRTCILLGTANAPDCIPMDPYGNRRYMTIPLIGRHDPKGAGGMTANGRLVVDTMASIRERLFGLAYRELEEDAKATGTWGSMLLDDQGLSEEFIEQAERHRMVDEWEEPIARFIESWEADLAALGGYFKTQELAEFCRMVKLESGACRYESYATVCRRYHGRVGDILKGKRFDLVNTARRLPGGEVIWGWWHKEPDMHLLPGDYESMRDEDRRKVLGIPAPEDLKESGAPKGGVPY